MAPLNILIVGCSIAGPTLATCLLLSPTPASQKPRIIVLERASAHRAAGQNIDIRGSGLTILRKLGLEKIVRESTTGEEGVQLVDAQNRVWAQNAADNSEKWHSPTSDIEIIRGRLAEICYERSKTVSEDVKKEGGAGIEYIFGDYLDEIEQDGDQVNVHFAKSGERRSFDLVVGADGLQSKTRNMVWGPEGEQDRVKRLGMYGGFFSLPRGENDTMWRRWFHAPGRRSIMLRPDKQRGRTTAFMTVINENDDRLPQVALRGHENIQPQKDLLAEYFKDAGWESERVIREMQATDDFYYDMIAQVKMDKWSKGRVVLLGDAGYCASPISGMGTTLALNGAYALAGALTQHPDDFTTAFALYEERMRPLVDRAQKLFPGMPHIMTPETEWGVWTLNAFSGFMMSSGIIKMLGLLISFIKPAPSVVQVDDYGFRELDDLEI